MFAVTSTIIFIALYIILIRIFRIGWSSIPAFHSRGKAAEQETEVSVVVCCRNEETNLPKLLEALSNQTYLNFELVLVNDHSTDSTEEIMHAAQKNFNNIRYIKSQSSGKKQAVSEGIMAASGSLIITTDADCMPARTWVETIVEFQSENPSHLIICPVKLSGKRGFFTRLQQIEFVSLAASGAGAAGAQYPIMCNAANMAFTKSEWLKSRKDLKPEEQSGDDIFLLQSIKKRGGIIRFLRSKKAFVETRPAGSMASFIYQRRRWAGKSTAYTDLHIIFTACVVFGVCAMQLILLVSGCFNIIYLYFFFFFFAIKYFFDTRFLNDVSDFFSLKNVPFYSFCLSVVYPFYIVFTALSALILKPRTWK